MYYALQDEKEKAIEQLKKAIELGYNDIEWFETDDSINNLRKEKEFQILMKILKKE